MSSVAISKPLTPTKAEADLARKAAEQLEAVARTDQDVTIHIEGYADATVSMPAKAVQMMQVVLEAMAKGRPVSIIPHEAELSTSQVADYLGVSRPFICKLIDDGKLPARLVNRHRRVRFADLLAFEERSHADRLQALAELAKLSRELGLE